ncbi:MAG: IS6 family transposase [Oscillospiraceae bacterium]|nr:IS6 family transposase [Oscillospiraceae bacterium]
MFGIDDSRGFDLNIEKVLENWEVYHALREIVSNALDEQTLTGTKPIEIFSDIKGYWHIRDYGRGLQYIHFTQNENEEKLKAPNLIGKFGVGLKDALATFDSHGIIVTIQSKHGVFTFDKMKKAEFDDIITLHAIVHRPNDALFIGTEFIIQGCTQNDIDKAKSMFLCFSDLQRLEDTYIGDVYRRSKEGSKIYINGVLVATEANFMFSYNITSLNTAIKKALNRERTNVWRTAYADRVKAILLQCTSECVLQTIVDETYLKINGKWMYLYRAVDRDRQTIDFWLSKTRDCKAAKKFFRKALKSPHNSNPRVITTDKYAATIKTIKNEIKLERLHPKTKHRSSKYLNSIIEQDHRHIKRITNHMCGFKHFKSACATIQGIEAMNMIRKGQANTKSIRDEIALVNAIFCCA